jgi:hypothetical protein
MHATRSRTIGAIAVTALLGIGLMGCASTPSAPAGPANLSGTWKQTSTPLALGPQEATIKGDTIEVDWVNGDVKSLYWAGSYTAPTTAGSFSWVSKNDKSKTANALEAADNATKKFTFDNGVISYSAQALGSKTTIKLGKK